MYLLLARNNEGMQVMNEFLSRHLQSATPFPQRPLRDERVWVIYPLGSIAPDMLHPYERIGVKPEEVNKLYKYRDKGHSEKFVVRQPVTFQDKTAYNIHRLLQAIDKNVLLSKQDAAGLAAAGETFRTEQELLKAFEAYPEIVMQTRLVMESCSIAMDFKKDKTKTTFKGSREADREYLRELAMSGLQYRYGSNHKRSPATGGKGVKDYR